MNKSISPDKLENHIKCKREDAKMYSITLSGLTKDALHDLENWLIQTRCDYVEFELANTFINADDIDEEWHIRNV